MSVRAIADALDAPAPNTTAKLVLLILANYADHAGVCWPSISTVARHAGCTERTVRRSLDALEDAGLLTRERLRRRDGSLSVYRYRLGSANLTVAREPLSPEDAVPDVELADVDQRTRVSGRPADTGVRTRTVKSEPSRSSTTAAEPDEADDGGFPSRLAGDEPYWRRLVAWAGTEGLDLSSARDREDGFVILAGLVTEQLEGAIRDAAHVQLAAEYVTEMTGEEVSPAARGHLNRVVKGAGIIYALRYLSEAIAWGAGLPDDDGETKGAAGASGIIRYAVAVWKRERNG